MKLINSIIVRVLKFWEFVMIDDLVEEILKCFFMVGRFVLDMLFMVKFFRKYRMNI